MSDTNFHDARHPRKLRHVSDPKPKTSSRNALLGLTTLVISLLVTLGIAELVIRIAWTPPSTLTTQPTEQHPFYGWAPRPGLAGRHATMEFDYDFHHTAQGLRGVELFTAGRPATIPHRVLFLGDSFTYGNGSPDNETFVARIDASLADTQVINTGANGYGQRQQLAILDTLGAALSPDLVIVMFFWNDVEDNFTASAPDFSVSEDGAATRTDLVVPATFDPLAHRMDSYRVDTNERWLRRTFLYKLIKEGARGFRHRWFGGRERQIRTTQQRTAAWAVTENLLHLMHLRSREIGATLVIVSIPDYERVDPAGRLKGQRPINIDIEQELRDVCLRLDIPYLDLLPELKVRQAAATEPFYYQTDRHFTPLGNVAVADLLTPAIESWLRSRADATRR